MIRIKIISVGKIPTDWRGDAVGHYANLISPFAKLQQISVREYKIRKQGDIEVGRRHETDLLLQALSSGAYSFGLDVTGRQYSTEKLAKRIEKMAESRSDFEFAIGGANGLDPSRLGEFDELLSLSTLTMPHDLARIVLLEQIYRALTIIRGHPYHK